MDFSPPPNINMNQHQHHLHQIQTHPHPHSAHAHQYQTPQSAHSVTLPFPSTFRPQQTPDHGLSPNIAAQQQSTPSMNGQSTYYDVHRTSASPRPSNTNINTSSQNTAYVPTDRSLPSRDAVTHDKEFEDAYVQFILYCNPAIPIDVNTEDLRRNFAAPPRSDGKTFSTRRLFQLLQQLDNKTLKTWTELALELGVEKPMIDKGQSSQKVQQYSVRLKRWLRASHIDAYFDYMMGKGHKYLELPTADQPFPDQRDGVCLEDDLALRALKPEFRPKRGRKRAESDEIEPMSAIEPKRPHIDTTLALSNSAYPQSAYPSAMSAHPDDMDRFQHDHWTNQSNIAPSPATAKPQTGTTMRWRLNEVPVTPNPLSAVTPISAQPPDSALDDNSSQSQKMRMRRRHGTAVSSAWPSNSTTPNGKLRGRPPTNRSVKDGPFISFPANPKAKEGPSIELSRSAAQTPIEDSKTPLGISLSSSPHSPFRVPAYPTPISAVSTTSRIPGRPERLSLQVPQHVGNPVSLVTPTVLVNGEDDQQFRRPDSAHSLTSGHPRSQVPSSTPVISYEELKRALAADLLKADVTGRRKTLRGTEARDLAESMLANLRSRISSPQINEHAQSADEVFRLSCASWLGINPPPSSLAPAWNQVTQSGVKKIHIRRFKVNHDGYDIPMDDSEDDEAEQEGANPIKQTFDIEYELSLGGMSAKFQLKGLMLGDASLNDRHRNDAGQQLDLNEMSDSWRQKYMALQGQLRDRTDEIKHLKDKVLEAVL